MARAVYAVSAIAAGAAFACCYSAIYMPDATMLLAGLNVNLNYSHLAAGLAVCCATVALVMWCYGTNKDKADKVRPSCCFIGTNMQETQADRAVDQQCGKTE